MRADRGVWLGLGVLAIAIGVAWEATRRPSQRLADGTLLVLDKVEVGKVFTDAHGTLLENLFGPLIPPNGLRVAQFRLQRPQHLYSFHRTTPALTAKFSLLGSPARLAKSELVRPKFNGQFRVVISGDDGFGYVTWFDSFGRYRDGYVSYAETETFPRHSKRLRLAIERRDRVGGPWIRLVEFPVTGLAQADPKNWIPDRYPISHSMAGTDFRLGEITVQPAPPDSPEIWKYTVGIPVQVTENDIPATNWLGSLELEDASGNHSWGLWAATRAGIPFLFGMPAWEQDATHLRISPRGSIRSGQPLDPRQVWRVHAAFERFAGFAATNVFKVEVSGNAFASAFAPVTTNLPAGTLSIEVGGQVVELRLTPMRKDFAVHLVRVQDLRGHDLKSGMTRCEPCLWQSVLAEPILPRSVPEGKINVTVAIEPVLRLDFTARPRVVP